MGSAAVWELIPTTIGRRLLQCNHGIEMQALVDSAVNATFENVSVPRDRGLTPSPQMELTKEPCRLADVL